MNNQESPNWKQKLEELAREINQTSSSAGSKTELSAQIEQTINRVRDWFNGLTPVGKGVAGAIAVIVGFSVLSTVLQVVSSLLSIAIMGIFLYLGYKFFVALQSSE